MTNRPTSDCSGFTVVEGGQADGQRVLLEVGGAHQRVEELVQGWGAGVATSSKGSWPTRKPSSWHWRERLYAAELALPAADASRRS